MDFARDKNIHTELGKFLPFKTSNKGTRIDFYSTRRQSIKTLGECAQFLVLKSNAEQRNEKLEKKKIVDDFDETKF